MGQLCNKIVLYLLHPLLYNLRMILACYLIIMNILTFIVYGVDKHKAKKGKWRVPESTLILLAVLGGAPGAGIGMLVWHHKTRKPKFYITIPVLVFLQVAVYIFCLYQNYHLTVSSYDVDIGLKEDMTIVQISDLHNQFFGLNQSALLNRIEELSPDMIVVTGDVVDSFHTSYGIAYRFFEGATKIAPVYYITGNHEVRLSAKMDEFTAKLKSMGVNYIDDQYIDFGDYILAGIADASLDSFDAYGPFDGTKPVIMLAHEPAYHSLYKSLGADLVFTGHIHGGQIIIPGKGALLSPEFEFFPDLYEGVHDFDGMKMVISRGLGNSAAPVRINDYPEIVVVKVR